MVGEDKLRNEQEAVDIGSIVDTDSNHPKTGSNSKFSLAAAVLGSVLVSLMAYRYLAGSHPGLHYNGKLGNNQVSYTEFPNDLTADGPDLSTRGGDGWGNIGSLVVTSPDGGVIRITDYDNNLRFDNGDTFQFIPSLNYKGDQSQVDPALVFRQALDAINLAKSGKLNPEAQ